MSAVAGANAGKSPLICPAPAFLIPHFVFDAMVRLAKPLTRSTVSEMLNVEHGGSRLHGLVPLRRLIKRANSHHGIFEVVKMGRFSTEAMNLTGVYQSAQWAVYQEVTHEFS